MSKPVRGGGVLRLGWGRAALAVATAAVVAVTLTVRPAWSPCSRTNARRVRPTPLSTGRRTPDIPARDHSATTPYAGNSRAGGDTIWRAATHFDYEQLFGYQVLGVDLNEWCKDGTLDQTFGEVDYASAFSYSGVGQYLWTVTISAGTSGSGDATDAALANQIASWANARSLTVSRFKYGWHQLSRPEVLTK